MILQKSELHSKSRRCRGSRILCGMRLNSARIPRFCWSIRLQVGSQQNNFSTTLRLNTWCWCQSNIMRGIGPKLSCAVLSVRHSQPWSHTSTTRYVNFASSTQQYRCRVPHGHDSAIRQSNYRPELLSLLLSFHNLSNNTTPAILIDLP